MTMEGVVVLNRSLFSGETYDLTFLEKKDRAQN